MVSRHEFCGFSPVRALKWKKASNRYLTCKWLESDGHGIQCHEPWTPLVNVYEARQDNLKHIHVRMWKSSLAHYLRAPRRLLLPRQPTTTLLFLIRFKENQGRNETSPCVRVQRRRRELEWAEMFETLLPHRGTSLRTPSQSEALQYIITTQSEYAQLLRKTDTQNKHE